MREGILFAGFAAIAAVVLGLFAGGGGLFEWRLGVVTGDGAGPVLDAGTALARGLATVVSPYTALMVSSAGGLVLAMIAMLTMRGAAAYRVMVLHPAALMMTAGGAGFAVLGLLVMFVTLDRLARSDTPADVPVAGLGLLAAALAVPRFDLIVLSVASPLFIIAPRIMRERNITSFYLVALVPAATVLGLGLWFGLDTPRPEAAPSTVIAASAPWVLAGPGLAFALAWRKAWRLSSVLLIVSLGVVLAPATATAWPILVTALAAGFALRGRAPVLAEWGFALLATLAVLLAEAHIGPS